MYNTIGLKADGTVVIAGKCDSERYDISNWNDIISIDIYSRPNGPGKQLVKMIGVRSDGTVILTEDVEESIAGAKNWNLLI